MGSVMFSSSEVSENPNPKRRNWKMEVKTSIVSQLQLPTGVTCDWKVKVALVDEARDDMENEGVQEVCSVVGRNLKQFVSFSSLSGIFCLI